MGEVRLKELLANQLSVPVSMISRDLSIDTLVVDSLEILELIVAVEQEYDIELNDEEFRSCNTLGEIADLIMVKIRG